MNYKCGKCGAINMPVEDLIEVTFSQTQEEPEEADLRCPDCGSIQIEEMS